MNSLRLLLPSYFRRLRWEIAGFWILSATASVLALSTEKGESLAELARAEVIVALWMVLRLALIDDAFGTLAGRQWRPLTGWQIAGARLPLVAIAFVPPLLLRVFIWSRMASPDAAAWNHYLQDKIGPSLLILAGLGLGLQIASGINLRLFDRYRRVAAIVFAVLAAWFMLKASNRLSPHPMYRYVGVSPDGIGPYAAAPGIRATLPPDALLLGGWSHSSGDPNSHAAMREMLRFPLREGRTAIEPGVEVLLIKTPGTDGDLTLELRFRCRDLERAREFSAAVPIVRFPGGHYSATSSGGSSVMADPVALLPFHVTRLSFSGFTPGILPWKKDPQISGAELILYVRDRSHPAPVAEADSCVLTLAPGEEDKLPALAKKAMSRSNGHGTFDTYFIVPDGPDATVEQQIRGCLLVLGNYDRQMKNEPTDSNVAAFALTKGRAALPTLLAWPTWSDKAWELIVRPLLLAHATEEDRTALLERLPADTRLSAIFRAKGWETDAIPVLRTHAADRLPFDEDSFLILAAAREPSLAADLEKTAARMTTGLEDTAQLLRDYPGFDWQAAALAAWRLRKYQLLPLDPMRNVSYRAAQAGDPSAFRYLAEQAALQENGCAERLRKLIPAEHPDPAAFVREQFPRLAYDPATRTWK